MAAGLFIVDKIDLILEGIVEFDIYRVQKVFGSAGLEEARQVRLRGELRLEHGRKVVDGTLQLLEGSEVVFFVRRLYLCFGTHDRIKKSGETCGITEPFRAVDAKFERSKAAHRKAGNEGIFTLVGEHREKLQHELRQFLAEILEIVVTVFLVRVKAKIGQNDTDRSEVDKNVHTTHHIIGDAKQVLTMLNARLKQQDHTAWKKHVFSYKTETEYDEGNGTLTPKEVFSTIARMTPEETMVTTDVGQHQMWTLQHFKYSYPGQLITSGGFGTMGFGLGAAIGAKIGNPDKIVVHITGDGSFRMNCNELATVEHYDIPVITVIFDNRTLGMVRQWQTLIYNKHYAETTLDRGPDFVKLAEAYGLKGKRVTTVQEMEQALDEALKWGHGYVIDCAIDIDEMVRPMVGGGSHITQFIIC